jgi:hypothetical protein
VKSESIKKKEAVSNKLAGVSNELGAEFRKREEEV